MTCGTRIVVVLVVVLASSVLLGLGTVAGTVWADFTPSITPQKKIIASGWHMPTAQYIREHITEMEKLPFDGLVIPPASEETPCQPGLYIFRNHPYELDDYQQLIADLRATKFHKFTDNFLKLWATPLQIDWFDDFTPIIQSWRTAAIIARQAGLKGLAFDPEHYWGEDPWHYQTMKYADSKTWEQYAPQVVKRGAEIMRAVQEVCPDITILCYFGPTYTGYPPDLPYEQYNLFGAFIDGMLSECTGETRLIDGCENAYYLRTTSHYNALRNDFERARGSSRVPDKYRRHLQIGFGKYIDAFSACPDTTSYLPWNTELLTNNYYTPYEFAYSLHQALRYTDEYVWIFTASLNFWQNWCWINWDKVDESGERERRPIPEGYKQAFSLARQPDLTPPPHRQSGKFPQAQQQPDWSDEDTFADLWESYESLMDLPLRWHFQTDPDNVGVQERWYRWSINDYRWHHIKIKEFWDPQGFAHYDGYGWYRVRLDVPALPPGKRIYLAFGAVDESAWVYINEKLAGIHNIGGEGWDKRFLVEVTDLLKPDQRNLVAVRVLDTMQAGGIWKGVRLICEK